MAGKLELIGRWGGIIRSSPLFSALGEAFLRDLLDQCEVRTARRGELVFRQGQAAGRFYLVLAGRTDIPVRDITVAVDGTILRDTSMDS